MGAQTGSITLSLLFVLIAYGVFRATVKREEVWLSSMFGAPFGAYVARTPRFWPDFRKWRDQDTLEIRPRFFLTTLLDGLTFFLAVPLFEALEYAQDVGWVKVLFSLP